MKLFCRIMGRVAIVFVSLCISFLFAEGILRLTTKPRELSAQWLLQHDHGRIADKALIFSSTSVQHLLQNNIRSADIIALGDSFVEGNAVADRYTFPSKLQEYVHSGGYQEHVVNMGIGGYGTDQEFKLLHMALDRGARPKIVLWALFNNDIYENYTQAVYDISDNGKLVPLDASKNWLYIRQQIVDRLPIPKSWKLHSYVINVFLSGFEKFSTAAVPKKYADHPDLWATQKIAKEFDEMEILAKRYDFQVVYMLIAPQAIYMPDPKNMQWAMDDYEKLHTLLEKRPQTIYVDFRYLSNPHLEDMLYLDSSRDSLPKGQRHFNEKGYAQFAQVVFSFLEMHNMLKKQ